MLGLATLAFLTTAEDGRRHPDVAGKAGLQKLAEMAPLDRKAARAERLHWMLRDPATGRVPSGIRRRELEFAQSLANQSRFRTSATAQGYQWKEVGPIDVGGRTRALARDVENPDLLLAGGVAGGLWKSTDGGLTWLLKTDVAQNPSVTSIVQDVRPGHTSTWYFASGEARSSNRDLGSVAFFEGGGVFKSIDGGETWTDLGHSVENDPTDRHDNPFGFIWKLALNPQTGTLLASSFGHGLMRSQDGGQTFELVLGGGPAGPFFVEVTTADDGTSLATLSTFSRILATGESTEILFGRGVFKSDNDGRTWSEITPFNYPERTFRAVTAFAPSNPSTGYLFVQGFVPDPLGAPGDFVTAHRFYKLDLEAGTAEDRSRNLPDSEEYELGGLNTQDGYNMMLAVKPDDEDFVIIGDLSLHRSRDGFATPAPDDVASFFETRIGGYTIRPRSQGRPRAGLYPFHHPDLHSVLFDPRDPNVMWSAGDGGLHVTQDILAPVVEWQTRNRSYNVTQFYTVCMPPQPGDTRLMGGTQDNSTPFLRTLGGLPSRSVDVFGGDGAFCHMGREAAYFSAQMGFVVRGDYNQSGTPTARLVVIPPDAEDSLFIHPFVVSPQDDGVVYFPDGERVWRHPDTSLIPFLPGDQGWVLAADLNDRDGRIITALAVSSQTPDILYLGTSSRSPGPPLQPRLYRLDDARRGNPAPVDISIPQVAPGAYLHNISVNPDDADELLAVFSNYNIPGLFHSLDAGRSWQEVEGNLQGDSEIPGPSLLWSAILPGDGPTRYFIATSIGLYSSSDLDGSATVWLQQGAETIGSSIVMSVTSRPSDGWVAAATHGRGIFVGRPGQPPSTQPQPDSDLPAAVFPFLQVSQGSFTGFAVSNLSSPSQVVFQPWGEDGNPLGLPFMGEVGAGRQLARLGRELFVNRTNLLAGSQGWVEMGSTHPSLDGLFLFGAGESLDGAVAVRSQHARLIFSRVLQGPSAFLGQEARTRLFLANPNSHPIELQIRLLEEGTISQAQRSLPPKGLLAAAISDLFAEAGTIDSAHLEVEVTSGQGVVGFELIEFPQSGAIAGINGQPPDQSERLYSAQLASGSALFSHLRLVNGGDQARQIVLSASGEGNAGTEFELAPGEALQGDSGALLGSGDLPVSSLLAVADGPGVVGSVLFGDSQNLSFAAMAPLQRRLLEDVSFSQVANGPGIFTGLALFNPGQQSTAVTVEVFSTSGLRIGSATIQLAVGERQSFLIPERIPEAQGTLAGRIRVRSDQPIASQQLFGLTRSDGSVSALSAVPGNPIS